MTFVIAITVNLAGMLLIYSLMAFALVRLSWHHRGMISVFAAIIVAGEFWIVPTLLVRNLSDTSPVSYSLSYCQWLISGFSVIVLCQTVRWIPRQLEDSARLDGCSWLGTYWHVLLPLVRRELGLIVFLSLMGTLMLLAVAPLGWLVPIPSIGELAVVSLVATLPVIVVFLFSKRLLLRDNTLTG